MYGDIVTYKGNLLQNMTSQYDNRRRLIIDGIKKGADFLEDVGEAIISGAWIDELGDIADDILEGVKWIADLIGEVFTQLDTVLEAIDEFVDLVISVFAGDVNQTVGVNFRKNI